VPPGSTSPLARIDNIGVAVGDVAAEAAFFREKLGLEVGLALEGDPPSATVQIGDQYLYLFQTSSADRAAGRTSDLVGNPPGVDHISFTVDDVDSACKQLQARGVEFDGEPVSMREWGIRLASFRDPEANSFFLVQRL
jgi:methylmalonyl-CoA/ethylmalonyl-CoA epimerase